MNIETDQKTLEFIQNIISRMGKNSLYVKGWTITIVSLLSVVIGINNSKSEYVIIILIPIFLFALLDAEYLKAEKEYRNLYNIYVKNIEANNHLDKTQIYKLQLNYKTKVSYLNVIKSWSILYFYLALIIFVIMIFTILL